MDTLTLTANQASPASDPMIPRPFRVEKMKRELSDTSTLELTPVGGGEFRFAPGQFNMLYVFGVGEVPISISGDPTEPKVLVHTARAVGRVTEAIRALKHGDVIGVRGPFGRPWPVEAAYGVDVLFLAGGIGLAPLRPAIYRVMADRKRFNNIVILYGARTPEDILYRREVQTWKSRLDTNVHVTVDRATGHWNGKVGVVTQLVKGGGFDPQRTVAFVCGPEVMMRYGIQALNDRGVTNDRIYVSMERNMKCAIGFCGHCQFGPSFVCKDGPVYRFDQIAKIFTVWEL